MNRKTKNNQPFSIHNLSRCISAFLLIFLLTACNSSSDKKQSKSHPISTKSIPTSIIPIDSIDTLVNLILDISATDFYKNQQPLPVDFRNLQFKYSIKPNHEILYLLCGEFSTQSEQNKSEWIHFTTIKNVDYEQWIGPNGLTYCENSTEIPYEKTDLAAELKSRLYSIQKNKP